MYSFCLYPLSSLSLSLSTFICLQDNFKVGTALVTLLQQPDLLPSPAQKLAAVTFLYDLYKSDHVSLNPFAPVFIHLLNTVDNYEVLWFFLDDYLLIIGYEVIYKTDLCHYIWMSARPFVHLFIRSTLFIAKGFLRWLMILWNVGVT